MNTLAGRADLLRILALDPSGSLDRAAHFLGYGPLERKLDAVKEPEVDFVVSLNELSRHSAAAPALNPLTPVPFWRLVEFEVSTERPADHPVSILPKRWRGLEQKAPTPRPLCPLPALIPKLRSALGEPALRRDPDIRILVRRLSRGQTTQRWPMRSRLRWPEKLHVMEDFATRLTPLWRDQKLISSEIARYLPRDGLDHVRLQDGLCQGTVFGEVPGSHDSIYSTSASILVIGDLGRLDVNPRASLHRWARFASARRAEGRKCVALTPAPIDAYPDAIRKLWTLVPWEQSGERRLPDEEARVAEAERLLGLLSHAVKIPLGLLRDVRRIVPGMSAVTEIDLWRLPFIANPHPDAALLANAARGGLHRHFREASSEHRRKIFESVREWCGGERPSIYFEAILGLGGLASEVVDPHDLDAAIDLMRDMAALQDGNAQASNLRGITKAQVARYFREMFARIGDRPKEIAAVSEAYDRLRNADAQFDRNPSYPPQFDPSIIGGGDQRRSVELVQKGGRLVAVVADEWRGDTKADVANVDGQGQQFGSFLAQIGTRNNVLAIWTAQFWKCGPTPVWAADYGVDEFGPWVTITVTDADGAPVSQRLRWIGPGRFLMGSPEDEPGRFSENEHNGRQNEGPQHQVRLTTGYWLFDTPVVQKLWVAVMGENPSRFVDPGRPVERVSWDDTKRFIEQINSLVPGLDLVLPTEAQWEYACRAGTETATYAGPIETRGANNAPILDRIAWYGGNSGVGFDLENGYDSSDWPEKQYDHSRAGTHPVGLKAPNGWGLYDMLGNVWEWCSDSLREYGREPAADPASSFGTRGALRGACWIGDARNVRAACRRAYNRDDRDLSIGFRCARVQAGAEPAEPGLGQAERQPAPVRHGEARLFHASSAVGETSAALPKGRVFIVRSDCEILTFAPVTRPAWASAIGRDRFGLWVEFTLSGVTQRMRWITPGRFMMGSPADELGRLRDEGPQHEVRLSKGYWLFDTPATQALWVAVMKNNPSHFSDPRRPVEQVSWDDTERFLRRINGLAPGLDLVLPTEAQWEYACRAGTVTPNYVENEERLADIAWFINNSGGSTQPVGTKRHNAWGLYDMLGNVWEWCKDDLRAYGSEPVNDPVNLFYTAKRALRGGAWERGARSVRAASRNAFDHFSCGFNFGFRCARVRP